MVNLTLRSALLKSIPGVTMTLLCGLTKSSSADFSRKPFVLYANIGHSPVIHYPNSEDSSFFGQKILGPCKDSDFKFRNLPFLVELAFGVLLFASGSCAVFLLENLTGFDPYAVIGRLVWVIDYGVSAIPAVTTPGLEVLKTLITYLDNGLKTIEAYLQSKSEQQEDESLYSAVKPVLPTVCFDVSSKDTNTLKELIKDNTEALIECAVNLSNAIVLTLACGPIFEFMFFFFIVPIYYHTVLRRDITRAQKPLQYISKIKSYIIYLYLFEMTLVILSNLFAVSVYQNMFNTDVFFEKINLLEGSLVCALFAIELAIAFVAAHRIIRTSSVILVQNYQDNNLQARNKNLPIIDYISMVWILFYFSIAVLSSSLILYGMSQFICYFITSILSANWAEYEIIFGKILGN